MNPPLVSVWMISYNHGKYIAQAIESVLEQEIDFTIELVIGDDFSTDNTREIILSYYEKHPEIIKPLFHERNVGIARNVVLTLEACRGKYIALLEGDDYWIDKYKLQKQVNFLEKNSSVSLCYTHAKDVNEITGEEKIVGKEQLQKSDLQYLLEHGWFIRTATIVFPRTALNNIPDWFFNSYSTDYILHILLAENGQIVRLDDVTAVYRRHPAGISIVNIEVQQRRWVDKLELLLTIDEYFNYKYSSVIKKQSKRYQWLLGTTLIRNSKNLNSKVMALKYIKHAGIKFCSLELFNILKRKVHTLLAFDKLCY